MPQRGVTWSHRQAHHLGLDSENSLRTVLQWPIHWIRLGVYWDESEPSAGEYNFSVVEQQLALCQKHAPHIQVLLTIGAKAPRWPEFYFPSHVIPDIHNHDTQKKLQEFVRHAVKHFRGHKIHAWQVENEPLDPSGPENFKFSEPLLRAEVELIRSLDARPIVLTAWGNDLTRRKTLPVLQDLGDIVGLDLYYRQHLWSVASKGFYRGPWGSDTTLQHVVESSPRPIWITELQAEPWEKDEAGYRAEHPESISPERLHTFWERARALPVQCIFFWGAEYWIWRSQQGDHRYIEFIKSFDQ